MVLIGKARQVIVRLRFEIGAGDAALRLRIEQSQPCLVQEGMNEGGDEDGLAGTGKAGDAKAKARRGEARRKVPEAARREAGAVEERGAVQCIMAQIRTNNWGERRPDASIKY